MDVFDYIAYNDPYRARGIITQFGYNIRSNDMGQNLRDLVAMVGEDALTEVMAAHPDRDYFIEEGRRRYKKKYVKAQTQMPRYLFADGTVQQSGANPKSESSEAARQMNFALMACALMLSVAIIVKK